MPKASAIIIGNEILNGKVQDANSQTLARVLFDCGVSLKLIETIPDHTETIVQTVRKHAEEYDLVFTSGGIGPTHDDITYDAVAKAFNRPLVLHTETVKRYTEFYGREPNEARKKMALLPSGAEILWTESIWVPTVFLEPVYILPGVPELFTKMLLNLRSRFTYQGFTRALVYSQKLEGDIAFDLEQVQQKYPELEIGSYPQKEQVMLSIEGIDANKVQQAAHEIEKFA
jgi:molybdenum cofactor synthesis domain-containing protein